MTNSCNQQFSFSFFLPIEFPFFLSATLFYTNLETFSYLPLMFLSNYINMQERKKLALFMCITIFLSFSRFFFSLSLLFVSLDSVGFLFDIDIPFIICVQMKETEWKKKKKKLHDKLLFSISLLNFISMRLQNRILLTKLST
jgi:hypothetical protein